jgi:predicted O-methyltransferase YrrM
VTRRNEQISPQLDAYIHEHSTPPDTLLAELAEETARLFPGELTLPIGPQQGMFMTLLARLMGARAAVEVGTFTGYSSICLARGLAEGGRLLCCDVSEEWTSVARRYWRKAGLDDRIELHLGPALTTLRSLPGGTVFDLAFIDADKPAYPSYWDELVPRIRPGGAILVDNTIAHGRVLDDSDHEPRVEAIRAFNDRVIADGRVEAVLLPLGDGLTLAWKK